MSLFKQFKSDEQKEKQGVEIFYAPNEDGSTPSFRVLRRGATNQRYVKAIERESAPYRRLIELGAMDKTTDEKIMRRVFCSTVLVGWQNVKDVDGKEIPYSYDNAIQLLESLPELYYDLSEQAGKLSLFRVETQDGDAKNS